MALQPAQRAKMRGQMAVSKRKQPSLVNRTNKSILPELLPQHLKDGPRFAARMYDFYFRDPWW